MPVEELCAAPSEESSTQERPRILLVDDNDGLRMSLGMVLEYNGFDVMTAANVGEAVKLIATHTFDALVSDLHMPAAGDGLTVASAMRHSNPKAVTMIFSAFPEMQEATKAILTHADEIMVKPLPTGVLVERIKARLREGTVPQRQIESIATILEDATDATIAAWLVRVEADDKVIIVPLTEAARSAYLPQLFRDLVSRLRNPIPLGTRAMVSLAAEKHGALRRGQGYSASMIVEESRMLQVSIFETLQANLARVDFSQVLISVMAIADEVDSQLSQAMTSFLAKPIEPFDASKATEAGKFA